jgi:P-loop containing dynein motor region D4
MRIHTTVHPHFVHCVAVCAVMLLFQMVLCDILTQLSVQFSKHADSVFLFTLRTHATLFALHDQVEACNASVRPLLKEEGLQDTPDACWQLFLSKCRGNLHIVLAMSPSGDKLRLRCRNFPGLVSASVIDWFQPWPADALKKVSLHVVM